MNKRYIVWLSDKEREELQKLVSTGKAPASKIRHASILLKVDANGPNWTDEAVADAFGCHPNTVAHVRQRFVEYGLEAALEHQKRTY
ncbi:MAG: helix-turn-helix domain-containing protein [Thermoflexia bacterium]|nr:MAG: helix-turn-helix domain-containing protein [Thermoflexia bacterium]